MAHIDQVKQEEDSYRIMSITITGFFEIPRLPDFIIFNKNNSQDSVGNRIDIKHLANEELSKIGQEWTRALIKKARS